MSLINNQMSLVFLLNVFLPPSDTTAVHVFTVLFTPQLDRGASMSRSEVIPPTTVVHSSLPPGGTVSSHKQVGITYVVYRFISTDLTSDTIVLLQNS